MFFCYCYFFLIYISVPIKTKQVHILLEIDKRKLTVQNRLWENMFPGWDWQIAAKLHSYILIILADSKINFNLKYYFALMHEFCNFDIDKLYKHIFSRTFLKWLNCRVFQNPCYPHSVNTRHQSFTAGHPIDTMYQNIYTQYTNTYQYNIYTYAQIQYLNGCKYNILISIYVHTRN